jgi:DNA-directed RNA polymerase specialized sigma24 family protein
VDNVPVTPPEDSGDGDSRGRRAIDLTALRECATTGEISVDEYLAECYRFVVRIARHNSRRFLDKEACDADDIAQEAMANALRAYGKLIDRSVADPGKPVGNVNALLRTIVKRVFADHNPPVRDDAGDDDGGGRPPWKAQAKKRPVSFDVLWRQGGLPDSDFVARQSFAYAAEALLAEAREQARRRLHALESQATGSRACPFHMTSQTGCPHAAQVFWLLGELIDQDIELAGQSAARRLRELGRELGLSSRDNELSRHLLSCFDWWSYQAFLDTVIDQPDVGGDRIRMPLVDRITAGWKDGRWDSSACPRRGAEKILATKPEVFERLLARAGHADVYEFLKRRAS